MAVKPSENIQWCESGTHVAEPTLKRAEGYQLGEPFPSNEFNWIRRASGRWLTFLGKMFGSNGRLQMDAANGGLAVTTDSGTELVYELQHDTAAPAAYSELRADRLLGRRRVRLNVDSNAEADGDMQLVADNLTNAACGTLTIGAKPGHATLTGTGVACQALKPTLAGPANAAQAAVFPRSAALYSGNLVKLAAEVVISYDGSGVPSVSSSSGYNLDTSGTPPALVAGPPDLLRLRMLDTSKPVAPQVTIQIDSASTAVVPHLAIAFPTVTGVDVYVYRWNSDTQQWDDALDFGPAGGEIVVGVVGL